MTITGIVLLIVLGIVLILVEIFFIPGLGFVGIVGFLLILIGMYFGYQISMMHGHMTLIGGAIASGILGYYAFRPGTWTRMGVKSSINSRSSKDLSLDFHVGEVGISESRLAPTGKARFEAGVTEVSSMQDFIDEGSKVEILKIERNKVIVKRVEN